MAKRKYEVSGMDEIGDIWSFSTNDKQRAEETLAEMQSDLQNVEMTEKT